MNIIQDIKLHLKKNIFCLLILLIIFLFDRLTKVAIIKNFSESSSFYVNDYFNLNLVWNTGIGFGLFSLEANLAYHLITILIIFVVLTIIFFGLKSNTNDKYLYFVIAGGAIGNIYDRSTFYAVPDFIDFHVNNYHWFTFNVADIFISIGIILLIIFELFFNNEKKN